LAGCPMPKPGNAWLRSSSDSEAEGLNLEARNPGEEGNQESDCLPSAMCPFVASRFTRERLLSAVTGCAMLMADGSDSARPVQRRFSQGRYEAFLNCVQHTERLPADFRISETPVFLTREFTDEVVDAANEIVTRTRATEFARHAAPNRIIRRFRISTVFSSCCSVASDRPFPRLVNRQRDHNRQSA
jgi:hypothetical protein